ncbi:TauD/TfdA family dioxygenase [soil metagenome]
MKLTFKELTPGFAAEATGIDLREPLDAEGRRAIEDGMDRYGVLVFPNQPIDQHQQIAFAKELGPLDIGFGKVRPNSQHRFQYQELADISNVKPDGEMADRTHSKIVGNLGNQLWHSDSSFQDPRAKYSMLSAIVVPANGGDTQYADLRAAYDSLDPETLARVEGLIAIHYALHSRFMLGDTSYTEAQRKAVVPAEWPLVQTDPRSGRKILYVGVHACEIVGMTVAEGRMLLLDLLEHATQRERVYTHKWKVGDLVMWDNTATAHRGRHFDFSQRRELRRATTEEVTKSPEKLALEERTRQADISTNAETENA